MNVINIQYHKTPYGELMIGSMDEKLCLCDWRYRKMREAIDSRLTKIANATYIEKNSKVIGSTIKQLEEYFNGDRKQFDIPLSMLGTDFQKSVWNKLIEIPFGETSSYLQLAVKIGNPKAVRAVANANGANAISIMVPCHRIIGSNGALVGYAGGLKAKEKLLNLEHNLFNI
jgi:methylated-DNA-[protein]-cysteine S-methyltransferase